MTRCLGTQNPLQNHLQKGLGHEGIFIYYSHHHHQVLAGCLKRIPVFQNQVKNLLSGCICAVHSIVFWPGKELPYLPHAREERICEQHFSGVKCPYRGTPTLKQALYGTVRQHMMQLRSPNAPPDASRSSNVDPVTSKFT